MNEQNNTALRKKQWVDALRIGVFVAAALLAMPLHAQLTLPNINNLPTLPRQQLPEVGTVTQRVGTTVSDATRAVTNTQQLLHSTQVQALLRANREVLEADPNGAPLVRSELIAVSPTAQALQRAQSAGFAIVRDELLAALDIQVVTLRAPQGMATRAALQRLRNLDREGSYDYNHVYLQSAAAQSTESAVTSSATTSLQKPHSVNTATRVGLIDAGVDSRHVVFNQVKIHQQGCDATPIASVHGTAVASLLVGQSATFNGAAPGATLFAADVYCGQATGGSMARIASALTWLAEQQVPVINVSLVGPDNVLLKQLIRSMIARGHIIVAAVGNDGPAAAPLYPASYPDVVGVTAVDAKNKVIVEAGRGPQVDFAAPGADLAAAVPDNYFAAVRGTSFAAPLVAGLLATHMNNVQPSAAMQAINDLVQAAHRLNRQQSDKTYGNGVVGESLRVALAGLPVAPNANSADHLNKP